MTSIVSKKSQELSLLSVTILKGVGAHLAAKLAKLGIESLQDLLFHLPRRYADRTRITAIGSLQPMQNVVIEGEVRGCNVIFGKRRSLLCKIQDGTGTISLRFYHFSGAQKASLAAGTQIRCYGETRRGSSGLELYHPEYQLLSSKQPPLLEQTLTPIYPVTEGITQKRLRALIEQTLTYAKNVEISALLPSQNIVPLSDQLHYLHKPPKEADIQQLIDGQHPFQQQLIIEELTAYQLSLLRLRQQRQQFSAERLVRNSHLESCFLGSLPFKLTNAQQRVVGDIQQDLDKNSPMMRLLQGDVGSGKTVVAAMAALQAISHERQVAIMAPTEILAEQHRQSFTQWFTPLGINVGWLTGKQKVAERREQLQQLAEGRTHIIVGTHALFQAEVVFHQLVLVIIDEQHRFGVHQRLTLRDKGIKGISDSEHTPSNSALVPHQLIMTATPIPRTLAMSAYADLDYSVIDELPKGRIPVETVIISQQKRHAIVERIDHACKQGRQAYWVCTLIEESETLEAQAAEAAAEELTAWLPELTIGLVHGRLKAKEKETVMAQFKSGEVDLLIATTVIEVGVDVPNASLMIIENPERLGLAQLHQLRGRVGRGTIASHCVLLYGETLSLQGKERLKAMRTTSDGFRIAEIDLELRGPGEVLGTRQTGDIDFKLADLRRDLGLMPKVKIEAETLLQQHPDKVEPIIQRWLGNSEHYANA